MRILPILSLAMLGLGYSAFTYVARADDCDKAETQATMNECAGKEFRAADSELNRLYKQIEARLKDDKDNSKLLVTTQKAWISFRDAECGFQASGVDGGSAYPMVYAFCLAGLTNSRIKDFKNYLNCEEGDLSCPLPRAN